METNRVCRTCQKNPRILNRSYCLPCINQRAKVAQRNKKIAQAERLKATKERRKEKKLNSIPRLKKVADKVFSDYIRTRDYFICQTCHKRLDKTNAHCSHFNSRVHMSTRYDENNCICQCAEENIFHEGNKPKFSLYLIDKLGMEGYSQLIMKATMYQKVTAEWLKEIIAKYTNKLKDLCS